MTSGHLTTTWDITPGAPVLVPAIPVTFGVHMGWHIGPNLWCCVWGGIQEARQRRILVLLCPCTALQSLMWGIPQQSPLFRLMTSCEADLSWENPPMPVPLQLSFFSSVLCWNPSSSRASLAGWAPWSLCSAPGFPPMKSTCLGWTHTHPEQGSSLAPTVCYFHQTHFSPSLLQNSIKVLVHDPHPPSCAPCSHRGGGWGGVYQILVLTESLKLLLLFLLWNTACDYHCKIVISSFLGLPCTEISCWPQHLSWQTLCLWCVWERAHCQPPRC